jgi:hypothetical protein
MTHAKSLVGLLLATVSSAAFACSYPSLPDIPTATDSGVHDAQAVRDDTRRYFTAMSDYVACVKTEYEAASESNASPRLLAALAARNNLAVAEVEAVRDVYEARIGPIEELAESDGLSCIRGGPRKNVRVVDDQTIVFYGRDGIYRNTLPQHCPLLREGVTLSFGGQTYTESSRFGQGFCSGQLIGHSEYAGTCTLGRFYPITESEAEELFRSAAR